MEPAHITSRMTKIHPLDVVYHFFSWIAKKRVDDFVVIGGATTKHRFVRVIVYKVDNIVIDKDGVNLKVFFGSSTFREDKVNPLFILQEKAAEGVIDAKLAKNMIEDNSDFIYSDICPKAEFSKLLETATARMNDKVVPDAIAINVFDSIYDMHRHLEHTINTLVCTSGEPARCATQSVSKCCDTPKCCEAPKCHDTPQCCEAPQQCNYSNDDPRRVIFARLCEHIKKMK